jgi:hypothetical protein
VSFNSSVEGPYYLAVHRFAANSILDCSDGNVFGGSGGLSGIPSANPVCRFATSNAAAGFEYTIKIAGAVLCTTGLVPTPVQNLNYSSATFSLSWETYTFDGFDGALNITVTAQPSGASVTVDGRVSSVEVLRLLVDGVNQLYVQAAHGQFVSAMVAKVVTAAVTMVPTAAPTAGPTIATW